MHLWFLIFMGHFAGMLLGLVIELIPKTAPSVMLKSLNTIKNWVFGIACVSIFSPWLVIMCYFFASVKNSADDVPDFVYAAFLGTLVLFCTFGLNSFLHNILGKYDFPTAEIVYITLSFVSKTFLAGDVWGGLRAGADNDDGTQRF